MRLTAKFKVGLPNCLLMERKEHEALVDLYRDALGLG